MKVWLIAAAAAVLIAAGVVGYSTLSDPRGHRGSAPPRSADRGEDAGAPAPQEDASESKDCAALVARVAELEKENRRLRAAFQLKQAVERAADTRPRTEEYQERETAPTVVQSGLEEESAPERERDEAFRQGREDERYPRRTQEWLDAIESTSGQLDEASRRSLRGVWSSERKEIRSLVEEGRNGGRDWSEVREDIRAVRERSDERIRGLLDGEQYEAYRQTRAEQQADREPPRARGERAETPNRRPMVRNRMRRGR